jgi:hypothetical protein
MLQCKVLVNDKIRSKIDAGCFDYREAETVLACVQPLMLMASCRHGSLRFEEVSVYDTLLPPAAC